MLSGRRVYLRLFEKDDLHLRVKWINDEEISRVITFDWPTSYAKTLAWFQNGLLDSSKIHLAIIESKSDVAIGMAGLINIDYRQSRAELYITIGEKEYWGRHLSDDVLCLLLRRI
jgi:RimJ/RimL family protein N-acetyltransferase